jgi:hypothetical protein
LICPGHGPLTTVAEEKNTIRSFDLQLQNLRRCDAVEHKIRVC